MPSILDNPVDRQILAELAERNQKHVERADETYQDTGKVYIFNVGPKPHVKSLGGLGSFTVQACPENRIYSLPLEIWKQTPEGYNVDMNKIKEGLVNGWGIAEAVVGYGQFMHKSSDMRRVGIFTCGAYVKIQAPGQSPEMVLASAQKPYMKQHPGAKVINDRKVTDMAIKAARKHGDERTEEEIGDDIRNAILPTEEEIDDANAQLGDYCSTLVQEANDYYRNNELKEIQALHRWAGKFTNQLDLPWMKTSLIMGKCGICGNQLLPEVAICLGCKSIVPGKEDLIKARRVPGYEWLWSVKEEPEVGETGTPKGHSKGKQQNT